MTCRKVLCLVMIAALSLLAGGCSSFNREWQKAASIPVPPGEITGRWQGHWVSDVNHHAGQLRCLVTNKQNGWYQARFHAIYAGIFTFGYTVELHTSPTNDAVAFNGQANLGALAGGVYKYEGLAGSTNFFSSYSCQYDHGIFQMSRP
jgi:hypothetical protein